MASREDPTMKNFTRIRAEVNNLLHLYPELLTDTQLRLDMLEAEVNFDNVVNELIDSVIVAEYMVKYIQKRNEELKERQSRYEYKARNLRQSIAILLEDAQLKKFVGIEKTVSIAQKPTSVVIVDESQIPDKFVRVKKEPNKTAIKDALMNNEDVPGAALSNGGTTLQMR